MGRPTISRIGNRGFTFIEVMLTVVVLFIGLIGIIRAYMVSLSALAAAQEYIQEVSLAKEKAIDLQQEALENKGLARGSAQGQFLPPFDGYQWQARVSASDQKDLNRLDITVSPLSSPSARTYSLVAYADNKQ